MSTSSNKNASIYPRVRVLLGSNPLIPPKPDANLPAKRETDTKLFSRMGLACFAFFLALSLYLFTFIQLLPPGDAWLAPSIPFRGGYGSTQLLPGVNYTSGLELAGVASFAGLFASRYFSKHNLLPRARVLTSLAGPLKFFGVLVASIVYVETHLLWGEFWYGLKFLNVNPSGFPWGGERVAANACFFSTVGDNCLFLNYDQLLFLSISAAILGWVISEWWRGVDEERVLTQENMPR